MPVRTSYFNERAHSRASRWCLRAICLLTLSLRLRRRRRHCFRLCRYGISACAVACASSFTSIVGYSFPCLRLPGTPRSAVLYVRSFNTICWWNVNFCRVTFTRADSIIWWLWMLNWCASKKKFFALFRLAYFSRVMDVCVMYTFGRQDDDDDGGERRVSLRRLIIGGEKKGEKRVAGSIICSSHSRREFVRDASTRRPRFNHLASRQDRKEMVRDEKEQNWNEKQNWCSDTPMPLGPHKPLVRSLHFGLVCLRKNGKGRDYFVSIGINSNGRLSPAVLLLTQSDVQYVWPVLI